MAKPVSPAKWLPSVEFFPDKLTHGCTQIWAVDSVSFFITRSKVTHQTPHNDLINAIFFFNPYHVSSQRGRPLTCQPLCLPQSSAAFVLLSLNMCHFHCSNVSQACLDKGQFKGPLDRKNYRITSYVGEKPEVSLFTCMSLKAGL